MQSARSARSALQLHHLRIYQIFIQSNPITLAVIRIRIFFLSSASKIPSNKRSKHTLLFIRCNGTPWLQIIDPINSFTAIFQSNPSVIYSFRSLSCLFVICCRKIASLKSRNCVNFLHKYYTFLLILFLFLLPITFSNHQLTYFYLAFRLQRAEIYCYIIQIFGVVCFLFVCCIVVNTFSRLSTLSHSKLVLMKQCVDLVSV